MDAERERTLFRRLAEVLALPPAEREEAARRSPGLDAAQVERLLDLVRRDAEEPAPARLVRALEPGTRLGDFRLVRRLGEGGMGQVWEAEQLSLGRRVALKLLRPGLLDERAVERLRLEAQTAAGLAHPGLVTVFAVDEAEGLPFIAQELVPGGLDLRRWIEERSASGPPPDHAATVARLLADVADALHSAHSAGVVHRDIKPHNLMLRPDGRPVVLDFGLAGLASTATGHLTGALTGTPAYLAPEQLRDEALGKDPRTDVYQLGATLFELLTLRRAFIDGDLPTLTRRILAGDFPRPRTLAPALPWALEAICLRAMALQPAARYADAGALRDDLRRFLGGRELPHAARGGPLLSALRRVPYWMRRHRLAASVLVAVGLGLAAGLVLFPGDPAPAQLRALRRSGPEARPIAWEDSDLAAVGDLLGAELELRAPATVYALSAFGDRSPPTWVMPVDVHTHEALAAGLVTPRQPGDPWGVSLPAGRHELVLSRLGESSRNVAHEGFILLVADRDADFLDGWFVRLQDAATKSRSAQAVGQQGVPYAQACELFDGARDTTRGEPVRPSEDLAVALRGAGVQDLMQGERFEGDGLEAWRVMWRVER